MKEATPGRGRRTFFRNSQRRVFQPFLRTRVRRNSLYSLIGFVVPNVLFLLFTPFLVHEMGTVDYGLWMVSLAAIGVLGIFEFGFGTAMSKYVAQYHSQGDTSALSATTTAAFLAYVAVGVVLTVPLYLAAEPVAGLFNTDQLPQSSVEDVVRLVALGLLPLLLKSAGLAVASGLQRFEIPMMISAVHNALTLVAAVGVTYAGGSVTDVVLSSLCVLWAVAIASLFLGMRSLRGLGVRPLLVGTYTRQALSYVAATSLQSIGSAVFGALDRIVVGVVLGLSAATYYTVSIAVASKLLVLADVLTRPLMPASSALFAVGNADVVRDHLRRATAAIGVLTFGLGVVLLLSSGPFLRLWIGQEFADEALSTYRVLIVCYAVIAIVAPGYHILNGIGYPWISAAAGLAGGVGTIGLIVVLGEAMGVVGAAWANGAYFVTLSIPIYAVVVLAGHADRRAVAPP